MNLEVFALAFALLQALTYFLDGETEWLGDFAAAGCSFEVASIGAFPRLKAQQSAIELRAFYPD
jgi:hypothetical protein